MCDREGSASIVVDSMSRAPCGGVTECGQAKVGGTSGVWTSEVHKRAKSGGPLRFDSSTQSHTSTLSHEHTHRAGGGQGDCQLCAGDSGVSHTVSNLRGHIAQ